MTDKLPPVIIVEDSDEDFHTVREAVRKAAPDRRRAACHGQRRLPRPVAGAALPCRSTARLSAVLAWSAFRRPRASAAAAVALYSDPNITNSIWGGPYFPDYSDAEILDTLGVAPIATRINYLSQFPAQKSCPTAISQWTRRQSCRMDEGGKRLHGTCH
jgi:hypothetical protein